MTLHLVTEGREAVFRDDDIELARYVFLPDTPQLEAPRPYLHPIRTRAGHLVSLFRPWDHVWHKGISWALPVVGDDNFWGGPTYVRDRGYVQLPNDGEQRHLATLAGDASDNHPGVATFAHRLDWITEPGDRLFTEERSLRGRLVDDTTWTLTFTTVMTNVTDRPIALGSPTTRGRENAGYGGLFWRGPRSFTDGTLVTESGSGTGTELRGTRHPWMAYAGRHDGVDASSILAIVDHPENPHHPPQWFARSEEFAALNPAPFFSEELTVGAGKSVTFRYAIGITDGTAEDAAHAADAARSAF